MNIDILLQAASPIPLHAFAAILAVVMGGMQFALPKGTSLHKSLGYAWVMCMLVVAFSSFFIHKMRLIGLFSPIHLLSILTIINIVYAIYAAKKGLIDKHKKTMVMTYIFALLVAGGFTFLPSRIMYQSFFG